MTDAVRLFFLKYRPTKFYRRSEDRLSLISDYSLKKCGDDLYEELTRLKI